jgi:hypothetical protein
MIASSLEIAKKIIDESRQLLGVDSLERVEQELFADFAITATSEKFPGGILVIPSNDKKYSFYAVTHKAGDWRRLRPLLMAFAGPTFSSFDGKTRPLIPNNPFEEYLLSHEWYLITKINPGEPGDFDLAEMTKRGLIRMINNFLEAPEKTQQPAQTTSQLISRFRNALNINNRKEASNIIDICRSEMRLDALNLLFMEVQMYSHFSEWDKIIGMEKFPSLCYTRKPLEITAIFLESIYQVYFSHIKEEKGLEEQSKIWGGDIRKTARQILQIPIPKCVTKGGLILYVLELCALRDLEEKNNQNELLQAIKYQSQEVGDFSFFLSELESFEEKPVQIKKEDDQQKNDLSLALQALGKFDKEISLSNMAKGKKLLDTLETKEREKLEQSELSKRSLQLLQVESRGESIPDSWHDWTKRLGDPEFKNYFEILKLAVVEWPVLGFNDSEEIKLLKESFENISDGNKISLERLSISLPYITSWLVDDPGFPRKEMRELYEIILYHLIIGTRREGKIFDSAIVLIRALLALSPSKTQYQNLLNDCRDLIGDGVGTSQVYGILDILEETIMNSCPDQNIRKSFWNEVISKLLEVEQHLSPSQLLVIKKFRKTLEWPDQKEIKAEAETSDIKDFFEKLKIKTLAIYSLTESASKQASEIIKEMIPNIKITINNDKVGTSPLKSLAQNADIFVIATSSAKHAATTFIQKNRSKDKVTLFASGRGYSSILRAIEEQCV